MDPIFLITWFGASSNAQKRQGFCLSALRAGLREPFSRVGDRQFRRQLRLGRDAGAVHRVQPLDQVSRSAGDRARTRRLGARDRALCRVAPHGRWIARAGLRRRRRSRPELFPVRDHARATRLSALSARRHDQAAGARAGAALRPSEVADKQDSQDICFVPTGLHQSIIAA